MRTCYRHILFIITVIILAAQFSFILFAEETKHRTDTNKEVERQGFPIEGKINITGTGIEQKLSSADKKLQFDGTVEGGIVDITQNEIILNDHSITSSPNLTPYQPSGWSDKIVVSNVTGTTTDAGTIYSDEPVYVDFAFINNGTADLGRVFSVTLYDNGSRCGVGPVWIGPDGIFKAGQWSSITDLSIGKLSAGIHTFKLVLDEDKSITELSDSDNEYSRSKVISQRVIVMPNLAPYQPSGWSDKIVVSNVTGTTTDAGTIYSNQDVYIDWAVINNGSAAITSTFTTKLYIDDIEKNSWQYNPPMNENIWQGITDANIGKLTAGNHTFKIITDVTNAISPESSESDNQYSRNKAIIQVIGPPVTPSNLSVYVDGSNSLHLTWEGNNSNVSDFIIERADFETGPFSVIGTSGSNFGLTDSNVIGGKRYYYRVKACNNSICSNYSNVATEVACTFSTKATGIISSANNIYSGDSVMLTVQGGSLGTGAAWTWRTEECHQGPIVGTGSSINVTPSTTTIYMVKPDGGICVDRQPNINCAIISINVKQRPKITTTTLSDFGNIIVGQKSIAKSYTVSGENLIADMLITATGGFEISKDNSNFSSTVTLSQLNGNVPTTTIYARFSPTAGGSYAGFIIHESSGLTKDVAVSGTGIAGSPALSISSGSWSAPAAGGTSAAVDVTNAGSSGSISYSITDNADWLTTSATSGATAGSFTMTADANNSGSVRNATVTITATSPSGVSDSPKTISVTQEGSNLAQIILSTSLINFAPTMPNEYSTIKEYTVSGKNLTSDIVITVAGDEFEVSKDKTNFSSSITLLQINGIVPTTTLYARFRPPNHAGYGGNISHKSSGITENIYVSGTGIMPTPRLLVSIKTWSAPPIGGTCPTVNITNSGTSESISYSITDDADWLTTSVTSGATAGSFTMTADANNSGSVRNATATITATSPSGVSGSPRTILVEQSFNPTKVTDDNSSKFPSGYVLYQNHPNPFNSSTIFRYAIPKLGWVSLKIYSSLGRSVAILVDGYKNPGEYEVTFDSSGLPTGSYHYTLQVGEVALTKTLTIVR